MCGRGRWLSACVCLSLALGARESGEAYVHACEWYAFSLGRLFFFFVQRPLTGMGIVGEGGYVSVRVGYGPCLMSAHNHAPHAINPSLTQDARPDYAA